MILIPIGSCAFSDIAPAPHFTVTDIR